MTDISNDQVLTVEQREELLRTLKIRFGKNRHRHSGIVWDRVVEELKANAEKIWSLHEMEKTGGEPDVIELDGHKNGIFFCDCSKESPEGRRSVCYDREALESRKKHKPENSAVDMAMVMGIELLTEEQYRTLQQLEEFDVRTSSWVQTPADIRERGGALFCDRRYGHVFVYLLPWAHSFTG
ncbi:DUF4256 domain-containing protein [Planococcus lenghuensis]|uniref:DUF4256 domain-containing protein n=1 Tax=Planococcus lenghuensis TaxID=2213202 RepID=A0A1Q2KYY6_9BACL|nr:DUF4256 domain-containing protein [Planococcus lenghuensis]AQQ53383.1 hypothetical protein B0X71_10065 [Planococcus lenghuensis]